MSFFKPKFVLLALFSALLNWTSGCTGGAFTAADDAGGGTGGTLGSGGSNVGGESAGTGDACDGPEDCNDQDACTIDLCNADGTCDASPKCLGTEKCCGGGGEVDCAECCEHTDCDDGVSCTKNTCFSGQCMFVPEDTECDVTQYCSVKDDCRARAACGILPGEDPLTACDDGSNCTTESCVGNLCQHDYCAGAKLCCEGTLGCAEECCTDSQCDDDDDPCTVGSCNDGICSLAPLCAGDKECCPSADRQTATCGSCCSSADCDDNISCTMDQCGGGECSNTPGQCASGEVCDPEKGCQAAPTCTANSDCRPGACQTNPTCEGGACHFNGCSNGTKCCTGSGGTATGCAVCCGDAECNDGIACTKDVCGPSGCSHTPDGSMCAPGQQCDPQYGCIACKDDIDCDDGLDCTTDKCGSVTANTCSNLSTCAKPSYCTVNGCSQCLSDSDCQGAVITAAIIPPGECGTSTCVKGQCQTAYEFCGDFQYCCPPYGCQLTCNIETR